MPQDFSPDASSQDPEKCGRSMVPVAQEIQESLAKLHLMEACEHVRHRPSMYIGSTDIAGVHQLFKEILNNAVDEVMAGRAADIHVVIHEDKSISVSDNGQGIPTGIHAPTGLSGVELAMTKLNAGGKFGDGSYKISAGLHGVGLACVNFLSEWCEATVEQCGRRHRMRCERGIPTEPLKQLGETALHGTTIRWRPDPQIFGEYSNDTAHYEKYIRNTCYLNPEAQITFTDRLNNRPAVTYKFDDGIAALVETLNSDLKTIGGIMHVTTACENVLVDIALQYNQGDRVNVLTFANGFETKDGGTHLLGFYKALTRVVNAYARTNGLLTQSNERLKGSDIRKGLSAVVLVRLLDPCFELSTKSRLANGNVESVVHRLAAKAIVEYLNSNPRIAHDIVQKILS